MKRTALVAAFFFLNFNIMLAQDAVYVSSGNGLNLREGPGTGHKVVTNIPKGAKVNVIDTKGGWVEVSYDGKEGYVSKQYLSEDKPRNNTSKKSSSGYNSSASRRGSSASRSMLPQWGVGLRLGDPSGVTAKKYLAGGKALEFSLGTTSYWGYDYRDHFHDEERYHDYEYISYGRRGAVALQVHYLFQKPIQGVNNLDWYWGFGGQLRSKTYLYNYRFRNYYGPGPGDYTWEYASDKVSDIDLGGDILIGLEWHIPGAPLSVFSDLNLMVELLDDPFVFYPQAGIGIRYNFN